MDWTKMCLVYLYDDKERLPIIGQAGAHWIAIGRMTTMLLPIDGADVVVVSEAEYANAVSDAGCVDKIPEYLMAQLRGTEFVE